MSTSRTLLNATDGGLDIFRKYIENAFEIDEVVELDDIRFKVSWNGYHNNYAVYIDEYTGSEWIRTGRYNAVWFVKEKFDLNANEAREKIDTEMNLGILTERRTEIIERLCSETEVQQEPADCQKVGIKANPLGLLGIQ